MGDKLTALTKDFKKKYGDMLIGFGATHEVCDKLQGSSPRLNYCLYGGIPRDCLIEFFGEEGGGKTTTALDIAANAKQLFETEHEEIVAKLKAIEKPTKAEKDQLDYLVKRGPKIVMFIDAENSLNKEYAMNLGVDIDNTFIIGPKHQFAESIFDMILESIDTDEIGLVILDSIAALISKQEFDKNVDEKTMAGISAPLTVFSRKLVQCCKRNKCTFIGINQTRDDMLNPHNRFKTTGGKAWKFFCTARIAFSKSTLLGENGEELKMSAETPAGHRIAFRVVKNKYSSPNRLSGFYTLNYTYGVDSETDLFHLCLKEGFIEQAGAWFSVVDRDTGELIDSSEGEPAKCQGMLKMIDIIRTDDKIYNYLWEKLDVIINKPPTKEN